jgi:hypothetical protein
VSRWGHDRFRVVGSSGRIHYSVKA